jgi:hypothetical protein
MVVRPTLRLPQALPVFPDKRSPVVGSSARNVVQKHCILQPLIRLVMQAVDHHRNDQLRPGVNQLGDTIPTRWGRVPEQLL